MRQTYNSAMRPIRPSDALLKENSIGLLRLVLASMVVFFHAFALTDTDDPGGMWGRVAVGGFFFLSGVLITKSCIACNDFRDYIWRRSLRIFPGLWACLAFSAFVIAPIAFAIQGKPFQFMPAALYFLRGIPMVAGATPSVGDVFAGATVDAMNGSLWTLPLEYVSYLVVGLAGWVGALKRPWIMAVVAGIFYVWYVFPQTRLPLLHPSMPTTISAPVVLEPYLLFAIGSAWYLWRDRVAVPRWLGPIATAAAISVLIYESEAPGYQYPAAALRVLVIPIALLWLAEVIPLYKFGSKRDLSYGTYIYSFPIQQVLVLTGLGAWAVFAISFPLTLLAAWLSWTFVESKALRHKSRFSRKRIQGLPQIERPAVESPLDLRPDQAGSQP